MSQRISHLVILGAGSAGWLAALCARAHFPELKITVIGSTEIGIIGAGEGTVPFIHTFLNKINLSSTDIIKNCKGTQKLAIKYVDWSNKKTFDNLNNSYYYHAFKVGGFGHNPTTLGMFPHLSEIVDMKAIINNERLDMYNLEDYLCENNKSSFSEKKFGQETFKDALQFDANLLAAYLKPISQMRNIIYVDDVIENFDLTENGDIKTIICKNKTIDCDFVFDCTGFKRLVTGKLYKTKWISLKNRLPVKKAMPFFLPPEKYEPYTTAAAMKFGWVWKIPLQHRSGCGYVFDSDLCDEESAYNELKEKFGKVDIIRTIDFDAGFYEKAWINNTISFGLSSGFVEPLEATSLMTTMYTLIEAMRLLSVNHKDKNIINTFNNYFVSSWNQVADFVQFHYLTNRDDTEFWRRVNSAEKSESLIHILDCFKISTPQVFFRELDRMYRYYPNAFGVYSWLRVGLGINIFPKKMLESQIENMRKYSLSNDMTIVKTAVEEASKQYTTHEEYLSNIVGKETFVQNKNSIFNI